MEGSFHLHTHSGTADKFPLHLWCQLIPQMERQLNLLHQSHSNPKISSYAHLSGHHNYKCHSFVPIRMEALVHDKPHCQKSFAQHCTQRVCFRHLNRTLSLLNHMYPCLSSNTHIGNCIFQTQVHYQSHHHSSGCHHCCHSKPVTCPRTNTAATHLNNTSEQVTTHQSHTTSENHPSNTHNNTKSHSNSQHTPIAYRSLTNNPACHRRHNPNLHPHTQSFQTLIAIRVTTMTEHHCNIHFNHPTSPQHPLQG